MSSRQGAQNELGIWDQGFYKAQALRQIQQRGGFFLLPWPHNITVWQTDAAGQPTAPIDVAAQLKASTEQSFEWSAVALGQKQNSRLAPVRLIAYRLPEEKANRRRAQLREKSRTYGRQPTQESL